MATFIAYPAGELGRSASGVRGAIVNAASASAARTRANALRSNGSDPDFSDAAAWAFEQINTTDASVEALVEGTILRPGLVTRRGS